MENENKKTIDIGWGIKLLAIVLVLVIGYFLYLHYSTRPEEGENKYLIEQRKLNARLDTIIKNTDNTKRYSDTLLREWRDSNLRGSLDSIKNKYDDKKDIIRDQPIDSTVRDLSEWINE